MASRISFMVVCIIGFVLWTALVMAGTNTFSGQRPSSESALGLAAVIAFLGMVGQWLYSLGSRGRILLDCGPQKFAARFSAVLIAVLMLIASLLSTFFSPLFTIFYISISIVFLITGLGRFQIRENGIWKEGILVRWNKIDSYRWMNDSTLLIERKGFWSFIPGVRIPVPPGKKEAVETLLAEHCIYKKTVRP